MQQLVSDPTLSSESTQPGAFTYNAWLEFFSELFPAFTPTRCFATENLQKTIWWEAV